MGRRPEVSAGAISGRWRLLPLLCLPTLAMLLSSNIVFIALPDMAAAFPGFSSLPEWVLASYSLTAACLALPAGEAGDRYGLRRVFLAGIVLYLLGTGLCLLSGSGSELILGRCLSGMGAAVLAPVSLAYLKRLFPPQEQPVAFGYWSASVTIGTVLGPLLGGLIQSLGSWRLVFVAPALPVLLVLVMIRRLPRCEPLGTPRPLDPLGLVGVASVCALAILLLTEAPTMGWPLLTLGSGALVAISLLTWRHIRRSQQPVLDPAVVMRSRWWIPSLLQFSIRALFVATMTVFTIDLQSFSGLTPLATSLRLMPFCLVSGVMSLASGHLSQGAAGRRWMVTVFLVAAGSYAMLAHLAPNGLLEWGWVALLGFGLLYGNTAQLSRQAISCFQSGEAMRGSAMNTMVLNLGLSFGASLYSLSTYGFLDRLLAQRAGWPLASSGTLRLTQVGPALSQLGLSAQQLAHWHEVFAQAVRRSFADGFLLFALICVAGSWLSLRLHAEIQPHES